MLSCRMACCMVGFLANSKSVIINGKAVCRSQRVSIGVHIAEPSIQGCSPIRTPNTEQAQHPGLQDCTDNIDMYTSPDGKAPIPYHFSVYILLEGSESDP